MKINEYAELIPCRPYCCDVLGPSLSFAPRKEAVSRLFVQPNSPSARQWLVMDLDHPDAWERIERSGVPSPTYVSCNPANGHAHAGWCLESPVLLCGREAPRSWLIDTERAFSAVLGADTRYNGLLTKNPTHPHWHTDWQAKRLWRLDELNDWTGREAAKKAAKIIVDTSWGRNCAIFDAIRHYAYRNVGRFKKDGRTQEAFREHLLVMASEINFRNYRNRLLTIMELAGIAKSVAKWTWNKMDPHKFSLLQSARVQVRWRDTISNETTKPWQAEGISRATWFRRKSRAAEKP